MAKNKEQEYDAIASQIGNLGGEPTTPEKTDLGSIKRPGQKQALSHDEEDAKEAFLARTDKAREEYFDKLSDSMETKVPFTDRIIDNETPIAEGWIPLNRKEFGIRSQFYPEDWEFYIRPATVMAIKNWVGIDEKNALQMNKTFDEIIKQCVKIRVGSNTMSWSHLNTWDRFWMILKIREATFANNKKTVTFEDTCSECDEDITFELRSDTLHYVFPDEDIVKKHWNANDMTWDIDLSEYGVADHDPVTLYTPTLAKQQAIIEWAQRMYNRNKKIDETFTSMFLPWMISRVPKEEIQVDKLFQKLEKEYKSWSVACHELMTDIIRNITINPKETLRQVCPYCGEEVVSNVQFPNGIKILFQTETGVQKFGTR